MHHIMRLLHKFASATLFIAACALFAGTADAKQHRSQAARHEFVRLHACPATGLHKLPCKGYIIDHKMPLCAHGPDNASNLQWSELKESKRKDIEELKLCRMIKRGEIQAESDTGDLCRVLSPSQWPLLTKALCVGDKHAAESN